MRKLTMFSAIMICMLWASQSHSDQLKTGIMKSSPSPNQITSTPKPTPQVPGIKTAPGVTTPVPTKQGITAPIGKKTTIAVKNPVQGTRHPAGKPLTIIWDRSAIGTAAKVNILLVDKPGGTAKATIKAGAPNTGSFTSWIAPQQYTAAGNSWSVRIETADKKAVGHSGVFSFDQTTKKGMHIKPDMKAQSRLSPMAVEQEKVSRQVGMVVSPSIVESNKTIDVKKHMSTGTSVLSAAQPNITNALEEKKADSTALSADLIVFSDYTIHSIRTVPEDPHTQEWVNVWIQVENKSQKDAHLPLYYKFKPLEGQSDGGKVHVIAPLVKAKEIKEYNNEYYSLLLKGKYLLSVAKDELLSKNLVTRTVNVKLPEDVKVRISKLKLGSTDTDSSNEPIIMTPKAARKEIRIEGGGFTSQSTVLYQNVTTGANVSTFDPEEIQGHKIWGHLPVYACNVPGRYKIWVKNPDGSETDKFQYEVLTPGQSPQIDFWKPHVITDWDRLHIDTWSTSVIFYGKGISKEWSTHWVESNSVSSDMEFIKDTYHTQDGYYYLKLSTRVDSPPQEGEIKIWIYNKHTDPAIDNRSSGQWFRIQVKHEPFVIAPPIVQLPSEKQKIVKEDVVVTIKDPPGVRGLSYKLEWRQQLGVFWQSISMLESISKEPFDVQVTRVIPADQFKASGNYQLRVLVDESTECIRHIAPAPEWSEWRTFEVVR
ncbi:MAG: hypothetical protein KUA37_06545 [Desulfomicrobium sp.]|nr:hypothetical protein [Pseudomonadota bacterium]MBV1711650.1 hypothetical protein [Desulfomicrobium sp.]MBU4569714.1 hypothetical protein [Pseudomonadota bacterium]MBU4595434.1 hypothetical protein [Pseudomonadota bacterium]MBV1718725.1 hypothetical protein [Desulfomicrobium sp.]